MKTAVQNRDLIPLLPRRDDHLIQPHFEDVPLPGLGGLSTRQFMRQNIPPLDTQIEVEPGVTLAMFKSGKAPYPLLHLETHPNRLIDSKR